MTVEQAGNNSTATFDTFNDVSAGPQYNAGDMYANTNSSHTSKTVVTEGGNTNSGLLTSMTGSGNTVTNHGNTVTHVINCPGSCPSHTTNSLSISVWVNIALQPDVNTVTEREPDIPPTSPPVALALTSGVVQDKVEQIAKDQLEKGINNFLDGNDLRQFSKLCHNFMKNLPGKAAAFSKDGDNIHSNPNNVHRLTTVSLYQHVTYSYCDDSGSMRTNEHYVVQSELVTRVHRIAGTSIPLDGCGVDLHSINDSRNTRMSAERVEQNLRCICPTGATQNIGTNMCSKILEPLVYKVLTSGKPLVGPPLSYSCPPR